MFTSILQHASRSGTQATLHQSNRMYISRHIRTFRRNASLHTNVMHKLYANVLGFGTHPFGSTTRESVESDESSQTLKPILEHNTKRTQGMVTITWSTMM